MLANAIDSDRRLGNRLAAVPGQVGATAATAGVTGSNTCSAGTRPEILAERDGELEQLLGNVGELLSGRSGMVTVTGRRGAGSSSLVEVVVAEAKALGLPAALARCSQTEAEIRYGVVAQLMVGLAGAECADPSRLLWGDDCSSAAVIPRLCGEFVAIARRKPLLIAVDDAQWADRESREWLRAMTHRLQHAPILLVQAVAAASIDHGDARGRHSHGWRAHEWRADPAASRVFTCLPPDALALVRAIAVGGGNLEFDLVSSLAAPRDLLTSEALAVLARFGLVVGAGEPRLASPIVADKVLAGMAAAERRALARRAAELGYRAAIAEDKLAALLSNAPPLGAGWAAELLCRVATRRRADGDDETAASLLGRALREPVSDEHRRRLLVELAVAEVSHRPQASDRRLHQVLLDPDPDPDADAGTGPGTDARIGTDTGVAGSVFVHAADLLQCRGDAPATHRVIATAYERRSEACGGVEAASLAAIGWLAENDCATDPVLPVPSFFDLVEQANANLPELPDDPVQAGVVAWQLTIRGERMDHARELARLALEPTGEHRPFGPRIYACRALLCTDSLAEAVLGLDGVLEDARRRGVRPAAALALLHRGWCELRRGNLPQAFDDLDVARAELPLASWHPRLLPSFVALEAGLHLARDSVDEAQRALARELPDGADQGVAWGYISYFRGMVSMALADPETALRRFQECGRVLLARQWTNPALSSWQSLAAVAHFAGGDTATARRLACEAVERAGEWGARSTLGEAHLWAARVSRGADALRELESAVRLLRYSTAPISYATALVELALAIFARGDRAEALRLLAKAADSVPVLASQELAGRIRNLSERFGSEVVSEVGRTGQPLSAAETRIAVLAADGRSNSEIAQVLATSDRIVELRLTGIYRKLALTGRRQLVSRFGCRTWGADPC